MSINVRLILCPFFLDNVFNECIESTIDCTIFDYFNFFEFSRIVGMTSLERGGAGPRCME